MNKLSFFILAFGAVNVLSETTVAPGLRKDLLVHGKANVMISFAGGNEAPISRLNSRHFATREDRLNAVASELRAHAANSQQEVDSYLRKIGATFDTYWISNQVFFRGATLEQVDAIAAMTNVVDIEKEFFVPLADAALESVDESPTPRAEWGVENVEAPAVWVTGNRGQNSRVGTIDTGVRGTHEALVNSFYGQYGWYDPSTFTPTPTDNNGHGTHTTGTIAGSMEIGVAPGSKWMSCRGCAGFSCSNADLTACGQFMTCPHEVGGPTNPQCSHAPHVVSNSWGGGQGQNWYDGVINAWRAANIVPVFANGNSGPSCGSANSPADNVNVIAVGSIDSTNRLSGSSSVGPAMAGHRKPDVSGPGVSVRSAGHTSDTAYATLSGTSMACPHAAGVLALMRSHRPSSTYANLKSALERGAQQGTSASATCGGIPDNQYPNHHFGHGRINAPRAIAALSNL